MVKFYVNAIIFKYSCFDIGVGGRGVHSGGRVGRNAPPASIIQLRNAPPAFGIQLRNALPGFEFYQSNILLILSRLQRIMKYSLFIL
jgi:hypothetical protein